MEKQDGTAPPPPFYATGGARPSHRPSILNPQPLSERELNFVPAPPSLEVRPRNASKENLEAKMDAMETLAKEAEAVQISNGRATRDKRASILSKMDVDSGVFVPPPPDAPRPDDADQFNYIQEVALREQLKTVQGKPKTAGEHDEEDDIVFPLPKHGFETVMERRMNAKPLDGLSADRIATQMEDVIFSSNSVKRAAGWLPEPGDIIVAAAPRCGQSLVVLMVRMLCTENKSQLEEVLNVPLRTAPWIECALVDEEPRVLQRKQPGSNRIFRTTMTYSMLDMKMSKTPKAKVIAVFRNPLDLRLAWFDHLKSFYVKHQQQRFPERPIKDWVDLFEKTYTPDDIASTPLTMVQNTFHSQDHTKEYEFNVRDWINATSEGQTNSLILFLEEILSAPERVLRKLAKFLGKENLDEELFHRILDETTGTNVIKISRRNSQMLTPDQVRLLEVKFGADSNEIDDVESAAPSPVQPRNKRLELLRQLENSSQNISSRGIFTEVARKLETKSMRRSDLTQELSLGNHIDLTPHAIEIIRQRWADTFGSKALTYEALYESVVGEPYPSIRSSDITKPSKSGLNKTVFATNSDASDKPPRKTILSRLFKKSE